MAGVTSPTLLALTALFLCLMGAGDDVGRVLAPNALE